MEKNKIFRLSKDFVLNIVASLLSTGIMQLILYPQIARHLTAEDYGTMLTIMGYVNVITLAFGNNLCNARLLQQTKYKESSIVGDFQIIAVFSAVLSAVAIFIVCYVQGLGNVLMLLGVSTATLMLTLKGYYMVAYRLELNYVKNLFANIVLAVAFIIGAYVLIKYISWPWLFVIASVTCIIFIFATSSIVQEKFCITPLFKSSVKIAVILLCSGLIANSTTYLDRFIIHPILGGEAVSSYATAAFFAKSINLVLSPIASVLLNYFTTGNIKLSHKAFFIINGLFIISGAVFFIISITLGPLITGWLYPTLIDSARAYITVVSIGLLIGVVGDFCAILVLANAPSYWQIVLSSVKFVIYLALGITFVSLYGIMGMCISIIITNTFYYIVNFVIAFWYIVKKKKKEEETLEA